MKGDVFRPTKAFNGQCFFARVKTLCPKLTERFLAFLDPFAFLSLGLGLGIDFRFVNRKIIDVAKLEITTHFDFVGNRCAGDWV
ncbi:MAG: hypothetical protein CMI32_01080 [Opitutales bacterium]|nr:hypothetical protein [Opitutales bacterium]|tara:strand:- start:314 stop:565 length:252 start_codon:yes stop_codon:yes gene_type:complete